MNYKVVTLVFIAIAIPPASAAPQPFEVCLDYHCDFKQTVALKYNEWSQIKQLFTPALPTAQAERYQIKQAIGLFEKLVGDQSDIGKDLAKNDGEGTEMGQLDCISESLNTTTFLNLMEKEKLFSHHHTEARAVRHPWIFSTHWTAVIKETDTPRKYAVDSWFFANGTPPVIQPLDAWLANESFRKPKL